MKKRYLFIFIISAIIFAIIILLISTNKSFPTKAIKITTEESDVKFDEYVYDFGRAKGGEQIEHIFKFRNVGTNQLVINKVSAPCGCTVAILSEKKIPPNGEGEIKASFNSAGYKGFVSQNINVESNAPAIQLKIQGIIETDLSVSPLRINFGNLRRGVQENRKIHITKAGDENLKILEAASPSEYLIVRIEEQTQSPPDKYRKNFEVQVSLSPDMPVGKLDEKIIIYTNDEKHPNIEISVVGNIRSATEKNEEEIEPSIILFPPLFFFGSVKAGETAVSKITIQTTGNDLLKIEKIENGLEDFISIKIIPKTDGKAYEIIASLKETVPLGDVEGFIVLYTNSLSQPRIEVPVNVSIKE